MVLVQTEPKAIKIGSTEVKSVYVGSTKVRPSGWTPGANTIAYYPLEANTNDYSGNNRNAISTSGTLTFTTSTDGYSCANFPGSTYINYGTQWSSINYSSTGCTIAFWIGDIISNANSQNYTNGILSGHVANNNNIVIGLASSNNAGGTGKLTFTCKATVQAVTSSSLFSTNGMHLYTFTTETNGTMKFYIDAVLQNTYSINFNSSPSWDNCKIGRNDWDTAAPRYYKGKIRQVVFEKQTWTADQVLLYYNTTK